MVDLPPTVFYPPFSITRASHVRLSVRDLATSRDFYTSVLGLIVSDEESSVCYLRAAAEAAHHSLVLHQVEEGVEPECLAIGMRVLTDLELDKAEKWLEERGLPSSRVDRPFQGPTLLFRDVAGVPIELCATMDVRDRRFGDVLAPAAYAQQFDHYQLLSPQNLAQTRFFAELGFRITDAITSGDSLEGTFMWRKGNTHDIVFFTGEGPRLHHFGYAASEPAQILKVCDTAGVRGYGATIERGPGRHPLNGSLHVYFRDPDGHRVELFDGNYQTIDAELEPMVTEAKDAGQPWGLPGQSSWFREASPFQGTCVQPPELARTTWTLEEFLAGRRVEVGQP